MAANSTGRNLNKTESEGKWHRPVIYTLVGLAAAALAFGVFWWAKLKKKAQTLTPSGLPVQGLFAAGLPIQGNQKDTTQSTGLNLSEF